MTVTPVHSVYCYYSRIESGNQYVLQRIAAKNKEIHLVDLTNGDVFSFYDIRPKTREANIPGAKPKYNYEAIQLAFCEYNGGALP